MSEAISSHHALTINATVQENGRVQIDVPLPPGTKVTLIIIPSADPSQKDLRDAANSGFDFWDNPEDDEDWNNA